MVGSHLADYILQHFPDVKIHGLVRWRSPLDNIRNILDRVTLHEGDLRDLSSLIRLIEKTRPSKIFHLAAQSYVPMSFEAPADTLETNIIGTTNLLEAVRITKSDPLIHICSSSEVYGQVKKDEVPICEDNPLRPASPYAVSKVGEDLISRQYFLSYGIRTIRTRMFTHTGPRRGSVFAESAFAKQVAEIEAGIKTTPVQVGNLDSVRTFCDVRDAVRAYWTLLEKGEPGEVYNIGGKETMTIGEMLDKLKELANCPIPHEVNATLLRPSDVTLQIPSTEKFSKQTGWQAEIPVEKTLTDLLDYHRDRIARGIAG